MRRILRLLGVVALGTAITAGATGGVAANDCAGVLHAASTIDFTAGYWTVGQHQVTFRYSDPGGSGTVTNEFSVTAGAPLHPGYVVIRSWGLQAIDAPDTVIADNTFNPAQPTRIYAGWLFEPGTTGAEALADLETLRIEFSVDGGPYFVDPTVHVSSYCDTGPTMFSNNTWHNSGIFHRA